MRSCARERATSSSMSILRPLFAAHKKQPRLYPAQLLTSVISEEPGLLLRYRKWPNDETSTPAIHSFLGNSPTNTGACTLSPPWPFTVPPKPTSGSENFTHQNSVQVSATHTFSPVEPAPFRAPLQDSTYFNAPRRLLSSCPIPPISYPRSWSGVSAKCGVMPNKRLKLSAPGVYGRIPFVTTQTRRRSLSAVR